MSFSIVFRCSPYWYYDNVSDIAVCAAGTFVANTDGIWSKSVITVNGSGFSITIDSPAKEACKGSILQSNLMSGDFLTLVSEANSITWTGKITSPVITPNWKTL